MSLLTLVVPDLGITLNTNVLTGTPKISGRANWTQHKIVNRAAPIVAYEDSGPLMFSFGTEVFAVETSAKMEVADICYSLLGLVKPIEAGVKPPSPCYLTYPSFGLEDWMCAVESIDIGNPSDVWSKDDECAMHASLSISLIEIDLWNKDATEYVRTGSIIIPFDTRQ